MVCLVGWPSGLMLSALLTKKSRNGPSNNLTYCGLVLAVERYDLNLRNLAISLSASGAMFSSIRFTMNRLWVRTSLALYKVKPLYASIFSFFTIFGLFLVSMPLNSTDFKVD